MCYIRIPKGMIKRISYIPVSIPRSTRDKKESEKFIDYLLSEKGRAVYGSLGYIFSEEEARGYAPDAEIGGEYELPDSFYRLIRDR